MTRSGLRSFATPRDGDLGLRRIANATGLSVSILPNGAILAIEHEHDGRRIMINQVLGSPLHGGIGRLVLRLGGLRPRNLELTGPAAKVDVGVGTDRIVWAGKADGIDHRATLWLHPGSNVWLWHVEVTSDRALPCDIILVQDVGLAERAFLMSNEAYASQYIDHHIARHPKAGLVVMSRQNLSQGDGHPWVTHGCLDGAASFATDALQLFGPGFRDAAGLTLGFGTDLPGERLQHEVACPAIQSRPAALVAGRTVTWTFFGLYEPDHGPASSDADLERLDLVWRAQAEFEPAEIPLEPALRSIVQDASPIIARSLGEEEVAKAFDERLHDERSRGRLLSFFTPDDGPHNRHVVLRDKELMVARRHGTLLRSGKAMLPDDATLCATGWMHGVFAAQLTIGNTSFHKLFSVSRDPYNITRASGLRILVELSGAWRLLAVPSVFDMGLGDCCWSYHLDHRIITVRAIASGEHAAMQWKVNVTGEPCRFLVFAHLVLGERELDHASRIAIDPGRKQFSFRPDPKWLWAEHYPDAVYHLVTGAPQAIETIGGDELLYEDGLARNGGYIALRTRATTSFGFAVVGSMTDAVEAERLVQAYESGIEAEAMLTPAAGYWTHLSPPLRLRASGPGQAGVDLAAIETILPWFAHNAMMHLTVPHGLEQYTGAAWGTRDVCQGPVEFFLSLGHDAPVKNILRILFAQQYERGGDWPQWFMLEPYSFIQDKHSHGDVIVWPLKALCDYVEATDDVGFLDEAVAWRREDDLAKTERRDSIAAHIDKLIATVKERFIPGTRLIRYGEGDWNDSLQPVDPAMHDRMVSSWTVALLFQQLNRYAEVLRRAGRAPAAAELEGLAAEMAVDFNRHLVRDGTVAGYAIFGEGECEVLLHPSDRRTGLSYSLLPMTQGIIAGLFTPDQARHHLAIIREHLLFPDGVRLMDRPVTYRGGPQAIFRRAESSSFFGREIGLMYVHAHLRYAEAMAVLGEAEALWDALAVANPITVTDRLAYASPRQRNSYFSSSDASFRDRYEANAAWERVKAGQIAVDGGWRIYSSGPGLFTNILMRHALGLRRHFGERTVAPVLPASFGELTLEMTVDGRHLSWRLSGGQGSP
ncbi:MAG: GH36-type glycosyl hydrolase domain-containing protein [Hyphomicrobiales bacterium]